jgi:tetratricopeptide (TPR) repeat protein
MAVILAGAPIVLFYRDPITYAHLIAEDFAGEYATAAAFAAAGLLFFVDAAPAPARGRKAIGLILGLLAVVIAGEEVSWGERVLHNLFGIGVPDSIRAVNLQGELNLHNLEGVGLNRAYRPLSYLLLGWLALSALLFAVRPALAARLSATGVPVVPRRLVPVCVLPPFFFLLAPIAKSDEIGELLVGVAALSFALDRAWSSGWVARPRLLTRPTALVVSLVAVGLLALGLAAFSPLGRMAWRLHTLAERDYPMYGMFEPAEEIFDYIYSHPSELEAQDTRLTHAEVLAAAGRLPEARRMLAVAEEKLDRDAVAASGDILRRIGTLYAILGEGIRAEELLAAAVAADQRSLEMAAGADERAQLLLSLARTLVAQGLPVEAATTAATGHRTAVSASTRHEIERWLSELEDQRSAAPSDVQRLAPPPSADS